MKPRVFTLIESLERRGFTTRPSDETVGAKDILRDGVVVLKGARAYEAWAWLRKRDAQNKDGK